MAAHPPGPGLPWHAPSGDELGRRLARLVNRRAELRPVPHAVCEVRGELLHLSDRVLLLPFDQHRVVTPHHLVTVLLRGRVISAGFEILLDLAEDPRIRAGGAPD